MLNLIPYTFLHITMFQQLTSICTLCFVNLYVELLKTTVNVYYFLQLIRIEQDVCTVHLVTYRMLQRFC